MASKALVFTDFDGGWSTDIKVGQKNSQAFTQAFDFRPSPSQLGVFPGPTREDSGVVKDLVLNEVMAANGVTYSVGDTGYLYKRTTGGVWSVEGKMSSGASGLDYRRDTDSLYMTSNKTASLLTSVTGPAASVFIPDKYGISVSTYDNSTNAGFNVSANQTNGSLLTGILVASSPLDEAMANVRFFQSDIEPLNKVSLFIGTKGTGDWTVTLHDGLNTVLATSTVTNANLNSNNWNDFVFSTAPNGQVRIYIAPNARTYHIHVTSTVADGTVLSNSTNDLSTANLQVWADRFVQTVNGWHPIQRFLQFECFGNGNYLSTWEPLSDPPTNAEWKRHALVFPMEYEVCGLARTNEFIVVAAEKNASITNQIPQEGMLFFWDGISPTYNYNVPVPEGSPLGLTVYKNVLYYYAGHGLYAITSPLTLPTKVRKMPGTTTEFSANQSLMRPYPNAMAVRNDILLVGFPGLTTNTSVQFGVYSFGSTDKNYSDSFGYNYIISTQSQLYSNSNNLRIGTVRSFGNMLHISWRDDLNGGYGVDVVNNSNNPAPTAIWQSMIFDGGYIHKQKTAVYMEVYWAAMPSGASVQMGWDIDRTGVFTTSPSYSSTVLWNNGQNGNNYARFDITSGNGGRFHEIQLQVIVTSNNTVTTRPIITGISLIYDDNKEESVI